MILAEFFKWYYYEAPLAILSIWRNFLTFPYDFFGIRYHLLTLFRPWHLIVVRFEGESRVKTFFWNLASRIIGSTVGLVVRSITITMGLFTVLVFFLAGIAITLFWLAWPGIFLYLLWQGFSFIL